MSRPSLFISARFYRSHGGFLLGVQYTSRALGHSDPAGAFFVGFGLFDLEIEWYLDEPHSSAGIELPWPFRVSKRTIPHA